MPRSLRRLCNWLALCVATMLVTGVCEISQVLEEPEVTAYSQARSRPPPRLRPRPRPEDVQEPIRTLLSRILKLSIAERSALEITVKGDHALVRASDGETFLCKKERVGWQVIEFGHGVSMPTVASANARSE